MWKFLNNFCADTLGVVFRALTGKIDPWTKQEIRAQAKKGYPDARRS